MSPHIFPLRVYIEDTDCGGVVYHSNYLKFFERARSEWAEQTGCGLEWQNLHSIFFAVCYARLDYLKPATMHQQVEVVSRIVEVKKASLVYDQYLRLAATPDIIFCKAEIKIVCIDRNFRPCALPESYLSLFTENSRDD